MPKSITLNLKKCHNLDTFFFSKIKTYTIIKVERKNNMNNYLGYKIKRTNVNKEHDKLIDKINSYGYISEYVGEKLEEVYEDVGMTENSKGYAVGIYLTGNMQITKEYIVDVFNNGLVPTSSVLTFINDFPLAINYLKRGNEYENSEGAFLVKVPIEVIESGEVKYLDGTTYRILPEYIYAFIQTGEKNIVGAIVDNPNYKKSENLTR